MSDGVAVVGIGEARVGRDAGCTSWELHLEAIQCGPRRCRGLSFDDVDGLISCPSTIDDHAHHLVLLAEQLGLPKKSLHGLLARRRRLVDLSDPGRGRP